MEVPPKSRIRNHCAHLQSSREEVESVCLDQFSQRAQHGQVGSGACREWVRGEGVGEESNVVGGA